MRADMRDLPHPKGLGWGGGGGGCRGRYLCLREHDPRSIPKNFLHISVTHCLKKSGCRMTSVTLATLSHWAPPMTPRSRLVPHQL